MHDRMLELGMVGVRVKLIRFPHMSKWQRIS